MKNYIGKKVLVTTSEWFLAPNGRTYKAVWGTLHAINEAKESVGFAIHRSQANWFIEIGNMVIAGCQVMYLMDHPTEPETGIVDDWSSDNGGVTYRHPSSIWIADPSNQTPAQ